MRADLCGFPDMAAAQTAAFRGLANATSLAALPLVGVLSTTEMVSCFVEVPFNLVSADPPPVARTILRIGGNCEIGLSLSDILRATAHLCFSLPTSPSRPPG